MEESEEVSKKEVGKWWGRCEEEDEGFGKETNV